MHNLFCIFILSILFRQRVKNIFKNGGFNICSQFKEKGNLEKALIQSLEKQEKSNTSKQLYV